MAQDGTCILVDATRVRPSPSVTILASRFAELAELLVQWGIIQLPYRINQVDILECRFLPLPCVGKHGPFEVCRDRLTDVRKIYRDWCLGDELLKRWFGFEHPSSLFGIAQSARCDINQDEWTKIENLGNSAIESGDCLGDTAVRRE